MDFGFTQEQQKLIDRVNQLVQERIAPRAAQYDQSFEAPIEDVQDLHREGWLLANLDKRRGGLGFGLHGDDPLSFFLHRRAPGLRQSFDGALFPGAQQRADDDRRHGQRRANPTLDRADGQTRRIDSRRRRRTARERADRRQSESTAAIVVSGTKHYATNASVAEWLWIGRVASDSHPAPIMFMMHRDTPGLKIDTDAWRPDWYARVREPVAPSCRTVLSRKRICSATRGNFSAKIGWEKSTSPSPQTISARRGRCTTGP